MKKALFDSLFLFGTALCILGLCKFLYLMTLWLVFWPLAIANYIHQLNSMQNIIVYTLFTATWLILLPMVLAIIGESCPYIRRIFSQEKMQKCPMKKIDEKLEKQTKILIKAEKVVIKSKKKIKRKSNKNRR